MRSPIKRRQTLAGSGREFDAIAVPTIPRPYTVAEVEADPVRLEFPARDLHQFRQSARSRAIAVPIRDARRRAAVERDADRAIGTRRSHRRPCGRHPRSLRRAHGSDWIAAIPGPARRRRSQRTSQIEIAVVGAHLAGLPLNRELVELGASLPARSRDDRRLSSLCARRVTPRETRAAESRRRRRRRDRARNLDARRRGLRRLCRQNPRRRWASARSGSDDGSGVKGFLVEAEAIAGAKEITKFGGWRAYLAAGASV